MLIKLLNKLQSQVELIGLDVGTAAVKLVRLLKDADGYTVSAARKEDIHPAGNDKKQNTAVTEAIRQCIQKANLDTRNVVCGIAGPDIMVRGFKFPPLPDEAIAQAVRFEMQQVCPFESRDVVLDYQLIDIPGDAAGQKTAKVKSRHGVMIACTENVVKEKTTHLAEAGVKPLLVDANALATLNCLNELEILDTDGAVAVIDVGWEFTNVVIYGNDGLPFVRDLNSAGRQIVEKISTELQLSHEAVRSALAGDKTADHIQNKILLSLNNAVRPLAMAINETLRFYSFQEKNAGVEKIYLCGGFALLDTFMEFFSDALPVEVKLLNPFEKMNLRTNDADTELINTYGPGLVVAAGLAMRTI